MSSSERSSLSFPFLFLIFFCAIAPFVPALQAGFVNWDDTFLITENPEIRSLGLPWVWAWLTSTYVNHYHPLVMFSYALEHSLAGYTATVFHITNILLHGFNTILVVILLRRFVNDRLVLVLAVVLFALHPLRTEAVVWISARKDLLSTFFILSSVLMFMRHRDDGRRLYLILSFVAAVFASLSKAIAVVIPLLMAAVILTDPKRRPEKSFRLLVPFYALALVTGVIAVFAQYSTGEADYDPSYSLVRGLTLPFWNVVFYAWKTILPAGLSAVYPYPENGGPDLLGWSIVSLLAVAVASIVLILRPPERPVRYALLWIGITLLPVLQWIPVGRAFAADRFTYLPAVGVSLLAGILLERVVRMRSGAYRPLVRRLGIVVLAVLGTATFIRAEVWKTSETLWRDVIESYPDYAEGYVYLGSALAVEKRDYPGAIDAFTESIRLDERNPTGYSNRALASFKSSAPDTAMIISDLSSAIALAENPLEHEAFLAEVYHAFGMTDRSFAMCSAMLDMHPRLHRIRLLRVRCAFELGLQDVVAEDIAFLKQDGIDVSIEQQ